MSEQNSWAQTEPTPPHRGCPSLFKGGAKQVHHYYYRSVSNTDEAKGQSRQFREAARKLRKEMTPAEKLLWECLRKKQLGVRFNRQFPIAGYIVDFYCRKKCLAIEIDGSIHTDPQIRSRDLARQQELEHLGVHFLRFTNEEVLNETEQVMTTIQHSLITLP